MIYFSILKTFLWDNKLIRNSLLILILLISLYVSYKVYYNHIYTTGYNEGVSFTQKQLDEKYNSIVNKIKEDNKKTSEIENKKLLESQQIRDKLKNDYLNTSKKLNEVILNSKSGLNNKNCVGSLEEKDFFNQ